MQGQGQSLTLVSRGIVGAAEGVCIANFAIFDSSSAGAGGADNHTPAWLQLQALGRCWRCAAAAALQSQFKKQ